MRTVALSGADNTGKTKQLGILARRIGPAAVPSGALDAHDSRWAAVRTQGMGNWWFGTGRVEEIAGEAEILRELHRLVNRAGETEYFYVARVTKWNFADRSGPEFRKEDRGEYILEEIPLTRSAITELNLQPEEISTVLCEALDRGELLNSP
ncbi:hypothetical protein [Streptomyces sp. SID14515]|uniref:hypothetical protein n=1 Tax=Streptomyces sp. SID14515 TaxID=2706074 RepID=UPI001EF2073E|nr:hypothetical protein [Streptomyces sp. SID14515]